VAARLIALSIALVLAGFGSITLHDESSCHDQGLRMLKVILGAVPSQDRYVDEFLDACRGSHLLALTANGLARQGHVAEAVRISDEAIRREPDNYEGWVALSAALRKRHLTAAADRAMAEVRRLNPRFGQAPG
jgi:predicted Zn-dependent protease